MDSQTDKGGNIMANFMSPYAAQTYALLRIVSGFLMMHHGGQKLFDFPVEGYAGMPWHITWVAGPIELIGGALIMVGLFTRWSAFLNAGLMAAAYWMAHGLTDLLPIANGGELAALYCFVFLAISANGPGIWSIDGSGGATTDE